MCYSAMVEQDLKRLGLSFQARLQLDLFEELFRRRLTDERLKIPRALEAQFEQPASAIEEAIRAHIQLYRARLNEQYAAELVKQRVRLQEAERRLALRSSKGALEEQRVATGRVAWFTEKLEALQRPSVVPMDSRIFPFWYAPVVVEEGGERVIRPMRYHCRGQGKASNIDTRYPGLYNARRDNLEGYWREQFGRHHAIVVVRAFYENVSKHLFERRALAPGERESNLVVAFKSESSQPFNVACLWDRWQAEGEVPLLSFAAITDDPPPEVAITGHDRCIVALRAGNESAWLNPAGRALVEMQGLLSERAPLVFVHRKVS